MYLNTWKWKIIHTPPSEVSHPVTDLLGKSEDGTGDSLSQYAELMCVTTIVMQKKSMFLLIFFQIYLFVKKNIMMYWYTREMLDHLLIKYLCESNVINICNSDIITGIWSYYSHRINTYPYLVTIYRDIFLLNIKDMSDCSQIQLPFISIHQ